MLAKFWLRTKRYFANTSGNTSLIVCLSAIPLLSGVGFTIDYSRYVDAKEKVNSALDAAILAGTSSYVESATNNSNAAKLVAAATIAQIYYTGATANIGLSKNSMAFKANANANGIAASGQVELPTAISNLVGFSQMVIISDAVAEAATAEVGSGTPGGDLEISIMLDVTGSMCDDKIGPCTTGAKMTALKSAAKTLVEKVVWADQTTYTSKIAIVPFSTRVRIGPDGGNANSNAMMLSLTNMPATWSGIYKTCTSSTGSGGSETSGNWNCSTWANQKKTNWKIMPCVTDRFYASNWVFDYTDDAPSNGKWLNGHDGSRMVLSRDSSETAPAGYTETWVTPNVVHTSETGTTAAKAATHWNYDTAGDCADLGAGDAILPLTNSISALNARIDGLSAYGATAGTLGTAFSWYLLSPNFGNVWPTGSTPQAYGLLTQTNATGGKKLRKIAILMTDGAYNTFRSWKDSDLTDMSNAAKQMCTSMKAKGIEVYTVGFALGELPLSEKTIATNTLQNCGSDVSHFYNSLNTTELANAFSVIGAQVGTGKVVRITK